MFDFFLIHRRGRSWKWKLRTFNTFLETHKT